MDNDIALFRKSLEILQSLNEKYKLYNKVCEFLLCIIDILE